MRCAKTSQRALQLERFVHRLAYEQLDDVLAPRTERTASEPTAETLHPGKPNAVHFRRVAVEDDDARVDEDLSDLVALPRLVVVVAEHRDARNAKCGRDLAREHACFFR